MAGAARDVSANVLLWRALNTKGKEFKILSLQEIEYGKSFWGLQRSNLYFSLMMVDNLGEGRN